MKAQVFNVAGDSIQLLEKVEKIVRCSDGRLLITVPKKCEHCEHVEKYVTQVPANYKTVITFEECDEIIVKDWREG